MESWDDGFTEPTEDERSARRIVALAVALINARQPLTTQAIRAEFYAEYGYEAFRKAFLRDRQRLKATGIVVSRQDLPTGQIGWKVDEKSSYAEESAVTSEDALFLDCLLLPLASDPTFPYARDLRIALTKIDRSFSGSVATPLPHEARNRSRQLDQIEACMAHHHAANVTYTRADGTTTKRVIAPLGLFPLRDTTYVVASRLDEDGEGEPHVYNLERMSQVREIKSTFFAPPANFDIRDFIRLPFELGDVQYMATFFVPPERVKDVREHVNSRGTWSDDEGTLHMSVPVSDEDVAAAWALAEGIVPERPASLVLAWKKRIRGLLGDDDL